MKKLISAKSTTPSPLISASSRKPPSCKMEMNEGMSAKSTTPSWLVSPSRNGGGVGTLKAPGVGASPCQLRGELPDSLASTRESEFPSPSADGSHGPESSYRSSSDVMRGISVGLSQCLLEMRCLGLHVAPHESAQDDPIESVCRFVR